MNSILVSNRGWIWPGFGVAGLNIPFSPTGISIKTIGFIVPATATLPAIFPVSALIVTPLIVTSPVIISTSWICFTPSISFTELISLILTSATVLFSPLSPPSLLNAPRVCFSFPPDKICAFALLA